MAAPCRELAVRALVLFGLVHTASQARSFRHPFQDGVVPEALVNELQDELATATQPRYQEEAKSIGRMAEATYYGDTGTLLHPLDHKVHTASKVDQDGFQTNPAGEGEAAMHYFSNALTTASIIKNELLSDQSIDRVVLEDKQQDRSEEVKPEAKEAASGSRRSSKGVPSTLSLLGSDPNQEEELVQLEQTRHRVTKRLPKAKREMSNMKRVKKMKSKNSKKKHHKNSESQNKALPKLKVAKKMYSSDSHLRGEYLVQHLSKKQLRASRLRMEASTRFITHGVYNKLKAKHSKAKSGHNSHGHGKVSGHFESMNALMNSLKDKMLDEDETQESTKLEATVRPPRNQDRLFRP